MNSLPAHLYKPIAEKIPVGDMATHALSFIDESDSIPPLKDIPGIKDLLIPQELFPDFDLSVNDCLFQTNGTSKGVIKQARVIKYSPDELQFVVVDAKDSGFPGELVLISVSASKMDEYNIVGNLLCKRK